MKNILVIGGTKGIGQSIANQLSEECNLFIIARKLPDTKIPGVQYVEADITKELPLTPLFPDVLDGLVYCPGSINLKPFHRLTHEDFEADWQVNFMGAVKCVQLFLPMLKRAAAPSIVLFSTVAVQIGMPFHTSISAAKGAVEGLTRSLAAELAPAIRVNCIAPSLTNTPLAEKLLSTPEKIDAGTKRHPLQKIGQPNDIASMACFLLSENTGWMTGQILHIDGGMSTIKI